MQPLPKWVLTNPLPGVYDTESGTAADMTAKVYKAMAELIEEYNAFADAANAAMESFTGSETEARAAFEEKIIALYREFQCQMDSYLRLNLADTAEKVFIAGINTGTIPVPTDTSLSKSNYPADAAAAGKQIAVERARIDNLAANNGSATEGNAELVDIRVDFEGNTHETAGEAVRGQAGENDKNISHIANIVGHNGDMFPHNKKKWTKGNRAYPNDADRLRSDYILIDQSKKKIEVKNKTTATRLYLELYSIDDSGEFAYIKDTGSRLGNTDFETGGAAAVRIVIHRVDNADLTVDDFYHASENIVITQPIFQEQKKIRVMQYNLGEFNRGRNHDNPYVDQAKIADYIAEYKKFFGAAMADILCLEEYSEFIDAADTEYPTGETLIDGIYPNKTGVSYGNTLAARHEIVEDEHIHYNNGDTDETGCLLHTMIAKIYGREVFVCSGNLRVMATEETRKDTFNQLLADCEEYDYVILGLDINALSEAENRYYVETAEANGYSVANGGYFGNIPTYLGNMYKNIDNIFVKGGIVVNAYAPDVADTLTSDHLPIIADILLY